MRCLKIPIRREFHKGNHRGLKEVFLVECPMAGKDILARECDKCRLCRISEADFVKCEYNLPNREERLKGYAKTTEF